jgi:4-amino-4-deoxy-L-arabinose transferase-like glycosyltransferase
MNQTRSLGARLIWIAFGLVGILVLFSVPQWSAEETFLRTGPALSYFMGLAGAGCALAVLHKWGDALYFVKQRISEFCCLVPLTSFLLICLGAGIGIRLLWVSFFPAPLHADGLHYFKLALALAQGHEYRSDTGDLAYWPPGYPFFISVGLRLLGPYAWVVTVLNLVLFSVSVPLVYALGRWIEDDRTGRLSALVLVLWPNYVASAGLGSKEMVMVPCLLATLLLYFRSRSADGISKTALLALSAGVVLGFASLTHPSFQLFPVVLLAYEWLSSCTSRSFLRVAVLLVGMAFVIFPWALRNHNKLGHWVIISDNGGDVFYRANNSLANGTYVFEGQTILPEDEVQRNRVGYQLGTHWIVSHPLQFLWLAERKLTFLLGDDGVGVYESMRRGLEIAGRRYLFFRAVASGYWFLIWMSILNMMRLRSRPATSLRPELLTLMLSFLFLIPIHSVFETDSRHHVPVIGALAVLSAAFNRPRERT